MDNILVRITNFEDYSVNRKGEIYSHKTNKFLKPRKDSCGYLNVLLNGKSKLIHRIVAETFLTKIEGLNYINHIDENKENNNIRNLEWCTNSYNVKVATNKNYNRVPNELILEIRNNNMRAVDAHKFLIENGINITYRRVRDIVNKKTYKNIS